MTRTSTPSSPPPVRPGPAGWARRRWLAVAGAALVTLLVVAVTITALSSEPGNSVRATSSTAGSSNAATAFTATSLSGESVAVPGGRPSVVFFFSAGCGTCGPGARALAEAQQATPGVTYVAVDVDPGESAEDVRHFLTANGAGNLAYARDTDAALTRAYQVAQLSTAVVLDASGSEIYRGVDPSPSRIRAVLAGAGDQ